jgi:hypothetical protein
MAALIGFLMLAQAWMPGTLDWLVSGDYDTTVIQVDGTDYQVAFGAGCEDFGPPMDVQIVAGSGGVATLADADGNGACNVLIGTQV